MLLLSLSVICVPRVRQGSQVTYLGGTPDDLRTRGLYTSVHGCCRCLSEYRGMGAVFPFYEGVGRGKQSGVGLPPGGCHKKWSPSFLSPRVSHAGHKFWGVDGVEGTYSMGDWRPALLSVQSHETEPNLAAHISGVKGLSCRPVDDSRCTASNHTTYSQWYGCTCLRPLPTC